MANTRINKDTAALIQKGVLRQPGFYGNQEHAPSNDSFNNAVNIASQLSGYGNVLKSQTAPANYSRTPDNYILTTLEKQAIERKSQELSSYGIIPYDTLEGFFYILAANDSYDDLVYISDVVGVPEMADRRYIRNIVGITSIPDIYKVGYLSQGVASVNQRYGRFSQVAQYGDYTQSSYGDTLSAADLGLALGVIGPSIISTSHQQMGYGGSLSGYPGLSTSTISQAINTYAGVAGGTASVAALASVSNPTSSAVQSAATVVGAATITSLLGQSPLGGALGSLGQLGGIAASLLLSTSGGSAMGGFLSEVIIGSRIATSKRANNPMLYPPSYAGKSFFGEAPVALPAVDQVFCRRVGAFGTPNGGSGVVSFGMQNFNSFGGAISIASVVSRMITGSPVAPPTNTYFGSHVDTMTSNICNVLNVPVGSNIEMRRSDNAIPFMLGFSGVMVGETFSPFGSRPFTDGWKLAASTGNDVQRYNPRYLRAIQTAL